MDLEENTGFCNGCQREMGRLLTHSLNVHKQKYCCVCERFFSFKNEGGGAFNDHFSAKHKNTHTICNKSHCVVPITPKGQVHIHIMRGM